MSIPHLTHDDVIRIKKVDANLVPMAEMIYTTWEKFEKPTPFMFISRRFGRRYKPPRKPYEDGLAILEQMGYIVIKHTNRGGRFTLPCGVWNHLPLWKQDVWLNPTPAKLQREREMDMGRILRIIPHENSPIDIWGNQPKSTYSTEGKKPNETIAPIPKTDLLAEKILAELSRLGLDSQPNGPDSPNPATNSGNSREEK